MFVSVGAPSSVESALGIGGRPSPHTLVDRTPAGSSAGAGPAPWRNGPWRPRSGVGQKLGRGCVHRVLDVGCVAAPHDFAVTESWYVMIQNCLRVDPLLYLAGVKGAGECLVSQPEDPVTVHLIPRRGPGSRSRFTWRSRTTARPWTRTAATFRIPR